MKKEKYTTRPDGRKLYRMRTGRLREDGKPEVVCIYAKSDREMDRKIAEAKADLIKGTLALNGNATVQEYYDLWMNVYLKGKTSITRKNYQEIMSYYVLPKIGGRKMKTLIRADIQMIINDHLDKPSICHVIISVLKKFQADAVADGYLGRAIFTEVDAPKYETGKKRRALTKEEKKAIVDADLNTKERCMISIFYGCGVRRGEIMALNTNDIDLENRVLHVRHVVTFGEKIPVIEERGKTSSAIRDIPIPESVYEPIRAYVSTLKDGELLFAKPNGKPYTREGFRMFYRRVTKKLSDAMGEPWVATPHYFRHNYATMLYYSGISIIQAVKLMGHTNASMIQDIYAHLDQEKEETVTRLNNAIKF